jgi:phosphoglycolate phosphatase-like HAD superfamily hydrolase
VELRKSIRMHFHYALFAEILQDLAKTVSKLPPADAEHRNMLREGAKALYRALGAGAGIDRSEKKRNARKDATDPSQMTPEEEVLLLHVLE